MNQNKPQLSSYIQFFDLLSELQAQDQITTKEKQQLKVALALKDARLINIIGLHMECEDRDELKYSILNYLKSDQLSEKIARTTRRSRSSLTDAMMIQSLTSHQLDEEACLKSIDQLTSIITSVQQGKQVSRQLSESLYNLGLNLIKIELPQTNVIKPKVIMNDIRFIYKKIKSNFHNYMHSHLMIMDEIISYEQLFILLKQLVLLLVGCDSFSFVSFKGEVDIYQSENDSFISLESDLLEEICNVPPGQLMPLESPNLQKILNAEAKRSYVHQVGNESLYFVYHQSNETQKAINYEFLSLVNQYGFFDEVNGLSKFLFNTIKHAKVHYFSPLEIADTIQEIGLAFVRCSKYLLIEKMLKEIQKYHYQVDLRINGIQQNGDTLQQITRDTVQLEFKDTQSIVIYFLNLHLQFKRDRELLMTIQQCHDKYLRFIKQCYEKRAFYKFFLRSNDSLIFEFDKRGQLQFLSRPIPKKFSDDFKISFNWSMIQQGQLKYNRIFENNTALISQIENYLQDTNLLGVKNVNDYMDSYYEIFVKTEEQSFKGFVVVFQQRQDAWVRNQQKSLSTTGENMSLDLQRRIKKSLMQQETLTFIEKLKESQEMTNSIAQLYMPRKKSPSNRLLKSAHQTLTTRSFRTQSLKPQAPEQLSHFFKYSHSKLEIQKFQLSEGDDIIDTVDFNVLDIKQKVDKHRVAWVILTKHRFIEEYAIPTQQLGEFLIILEQKYNQANNPFHNYDHGISVMQFTHVMCLLLRNTQHQLDYFAQFALVISALCHDVAHTGRTNLFEINSLSKLAIEYHDRSVLEQHHASTTIQMLRDDKTNFLTSFDDEQFKSFRKCIISNILHTDMSDHFKLIKDFEAQLSEKKDFISEQEQRLLTGMLIHGADFNGTVRKYPNSRRWSELVNQEFIAQFEEEGKKGFPQQPYMKDLNKITVMAKSEIGFCKVIVRPLYVVLNQTLENQLEISLKNIDETILEWEKLSKTSEISL